MELTSEVKALLLNTAKDLKGSALRLFMARSVQALGPTPVQHPRCMLQLMVERSSLCAVPVQPPESCELFFSGTRRTVGTAPPTERRAGRAPHLSAG